MEPFLLELANGAKLSGIVSIPSTTATTPQQKPLIIAIHGGTYTSKYFDASPRHSGGTVSVQTGIPFVAFDRPGYAGSSRLPPVPDGTTFFQEEARYIHKHVLPRLWDAFGDQAGVSGIVILGHSMGTSSAVMAAALASRDSQKRYPLLGLIVSGTSFTRAVVTKDGEKQLEEGRKLGYMEFPPGVKDILMLGSPKLGLASNEMRQISEEITHRAQVDEFVDRRTQWASYWEGYAKDVTVPVLAGVGGRDKLLHPSQEDVDKFGARFTSALKVESVFVPGAPHCMELSHWGPGWYARCFGFAMECAAGAALASSDDKVTQDSKI